MVYSLPAPVTQFPKKESILPLTSNYAQLSFVGRLYNFIEPILFGFHVEKHIARQRDRT
jgi:hypothetical protein